MIWVSVALLGLVLAGAAEAQGYAYATDSNLNAGGSNVYPFSASPNSWRYQLLFEAKYLPMKQILITDIAFGSTATNPSLFQASQFEVRMGHNTTGTLVSTFDNNFHTPPVTLFNGAMKWQPAYLQWVDLGLTSSFLYDGQSGITIEMRYRGRTSAGPTIRSDPIMSRVWNNTASDPFAAPTGTATTSYGLKTRLTYIDAATLTLLGTPTPGGTIDLMIFSPADAGKPYQAASSLGTGPIPLGNRQLNLTPDDLMGITVGGYLPQVFVNYAGVLDAKGNAKAQIKILNNPVLKGVRIHSAFVTLDANAPFGISLISNTATFSIQ